MPFKRGDIVEYVAASSFWESHNGSILVVEEGDHVAREKGFTENVVTVAPIIWKGDERDENSGEFAVSLFRKIGEANLDEVQTG